MKIIQTNNQLEITQKGIGQLIFGVIPIIIALALIIYTLINTKPGTAVQWPLFAFGLIFLIAGVLTIFFAKNNHFVFQKDGQTSIESKRIVGGKTLHDSFPTSSIVAVRLITSMSSNGNSNGRSSNTRTSALSILLNNNSVVQVASKSGSSGVLSLVLKAPLINESNQLADFLGLPLEAEDTSTIAGTIKVIRDGYNTLKSEEQTPPQPTPSNANNTPLFVSSTQAQPDTRLPVQQNDQPLSQPQVANSQLKVAPPTSYQPPVEPDLAHSQNKSDQSPPAEPE